VRTDIGYGSSRSLSGSALGKRSREMQVITILLEHQNYYIGA